RTPQSGNKATTAAAATASVEGNRVLRQKQSTSPLPGPVMAPQQVPSADGGAAAAAACAATVTALLSQPSSSDPGTPDGGRLRKRPSGQAPLEQILQRSKRQRCGIFGGVTFFVT
ncbi:hypothetical protein Vretifemale_12566, partial [Volvox reticuliferus]